MTKSHATWCHSKSCEGDCGHATGFTDEERVEQLQARVKELEGVNKRMKVALENVRDERIENGHGVIVKYNNPLTDSMRNIAIECLELVPDA